MPWVQVEATTRLTPKPGLPGLSPSDWIEIKTTSTAALRQKLAQVSFHATVDGASAVSAGIDVFAYRACLLEHIVVAWSDGQVTPEALGRLHPDVQDWIAEEFERLSGGEKTSAEMGEASMPSTVT